MPGTGRIHLRGLDGIRFIGAAAVIVHHVEQWKSMLGLPNVSGESYIRYLGYQGVDLFFVLSGFLITYLLAVESSDTGTISIRAFVMRRVCRILPLYYLIVIIALVVAPSLPLPDGGALAAMVESKNAELESHFPATLALFLAILPNIALIVFPWVLHAAQTWSIGVEEQFYLLWPWLLKYVQRRWWLGLMLGVILVKVGMTFLLRLLVAKTHWLPAYFGEVYLSYFRLEKMAIGGIGAWLFFHHPEWVSRWLVNPIFQMLALPALIGLLIGGPFLPGWTILFPVFAMLLIFNIMLNPVPGLNLENPLCRYLGKISYGLYMYHSLAIFLTFELLYLTGYEGAESSLFDFFLYCGTWVFTVAFSACSYHLYELPFLRLKQRFQTRSTM